MNILVLTSAYKDPSLKNRDKSTDIVNSFAKSFVGLGHNVVVIHNVHRYPVAVHLLPLKIRKMIAAKIGFEFAGLESVKQKEFTDGGAKVFKFPIKKLIPHGSPSAGKIEKQAKKILMTLEKESFTPDVILGHWASPQMELMYKIVPHFNCKSAIILHGMNYVEDKSFPTKKYLSVISKVGCRSEAQANIAKNTLGLDETPFVCYSGIPDDFLEKFTLQTEKFNNIKKWKFVYVGRLVAYKRIDVVLKALGRLKSVDWEFDIVGDGGEESNLKKLCADLGIEEKVRFLGRRPREEVLEIMSDAHCFVMVSKNEVFGLVYLEAMAASCIAIGSVGEGIDGIINDGENGYLVTPADENALVEKLEFICNSKNEEIIRIAVNGYNRVRSFSDTKTAENYLKNVISGN